VLRALKSGSLPWRTENLTSKIDLNRLNHAMRFIGVYPDGTPIPLTWMQWLTFGTPRKRIERKLKRVRERTKGIIEDMEMFVEGEEDCKDTLLIQNFILEQLSPFKRYALRHEFFQVDTAIPGFINGWVWLSAWAFIVLVWMFLVYWTIMWALNNSNVTVDAWAYQIIFVLLQEIFINELLQIFIVNVVVIEALRPQLRRIYFALNTVIVSKMADLKTTDRLQGYRDNLRVVQHMSAACRAARKHPDLPASQLLMRVDDNDAALCQHNREISFGWFMSVVIAIPTLLALSHESVQQGIMDIIFPTLWCCFLLGNAYLFFISPALVAVPYAIIVLFLLYRYCVQLPRRHRNAKRLQGIEHEEEGPGAVDSMWKNMNLSLGLAGESNMASNADICRDSVRTTRSSISRVKSMRYQSRHSTSSIGGRQEERDSVRNTGSSISGVKSMRYQSRRSTSTIGRRHSLASRSTSHAHQSDSPHHSASDDESYDAFDYSTDDDSGTINSDERLEAGQEMPAEIRGMKVHSKKRENFAIRDRHSKKKTAKLMNKYVWHTRAQVEGRERDSTKPLDIRPLDELQSPSLSRRMSIKRLSSMLSSPKSAQHMRQTEALQGLGELCRASPQKKSSGAVAMEDSRHSLRNFTSHLGDVVAGDSSDASSEDDHDVNMAIRLASPNGRDTTSYSDHSDNSSDDVDSIDS
jgi:hypothetical protein